MTPEIDPRLEDILQLLIRLGTGDLATRGEPSGAGDELDAAIAGINMLAEELESNREEMEQRVTQRTGELHALNQDLAQVTELGNMLQACGTLDEAYVVIQGAVSSIFKETSGALYVFNASRNLLEAQVVWGEAKMERFCTRDDCWALPTSTTSSSSTTCTVMKLATRPRERVAGHPALVAGG